MKKSPADGAGLFYYAAALEIKASMVHKSAS